MLIVRYARVSCPDVQVGIRQDDGTLSPLPVESIAALLECPMDQIRSIVAEATRQTVRIDDTVSPLPPIDGATEVWASGVTYQRSREGRTEESSQPTIYDDVYDAERPELFFKSVAWRVVGDGDPIGIRADSAQNVPEPELAVVANSGGEIVGYTVCNDVSSRSLEGSNPLYLPQAKIYAGACAIGPGIRPVWELEDHRRLAIAVRVCRGDNVVWSGRTSVGQMRRNVEELLSALYVADQFPQGVVLSTGTGLVPELSFGLCPDDGVQITIDKVGMLSNHVVRGVAPFENLWNRVSQETHQDRSDPRSPESGK